MSKKLTITIDESVYDGLYRVVGPRRISRFIEGLVRPHVLDLDDAYAAMATDEEREADAAAWSDALVADAGLEDERPRGRHGTSGASHALEDATTSPLLG